MFLYTMFISRLGRGQGLRKPRYRSNEINRGLYMQKCLLCLQQHVLAGRFLLQPALVNLRAIFTW